MLDAVNEVLFIMTINMSREWIIKVCSITVHIIVVCLIVTKPFFSHVNMCHGQDLNIKHLPYVQCRMLLFYVNKNISLLVLTPSRLFAEVCLKVKFLH